MFSKLFHNSALEQLFILITLIALAHTNILLFPTKPPTMHTKLKPKPNGPDNAFKDCYNGKCQCKKEVINCFLSDRSGALNLDIVSGSKRDQITLSCEGVPKDMDELLEQVPYKFLNNGTYFKMKNCLQLPAILRRPNVTYEGIIEYNTQMTVPQKLFEESKGLSKLTFNITTDKLEKVISPKIFHSLSHLGELELVIVCKVSEITVPLELFHGLFHLQGLSLYVYHEETGYFERTNSKHTYINNLTSMHFRDLCMLKNLLLDANHLRTLNSKIFTPLTALNHLGLSLNELKELPSNLLAMQAKLVVIDLSANALTHLPEGLFANTPLLWKLLLSNNQIHTPTSVISAVKRLHYLYILDLSDNQLTSLWGSGKYSNETLLARQHIRDPTEVPEFVDYVQSGRGAFNAAQLRNTVIILRRNNISHFNLDWIAAGGHDCPYELILYQNHIEHIYAVMQPPSTTRQCIRSLKLHDNPLHCDCALAWVYSSNLLSRYEWWTCATPTHLSNLLLNSLQRADLCPWLPAFCPERCRCSYATAPSLVVNCTNARLEVISQLPRPEQFALSQTTLYLERNRFYQLPANTTFGYANVTQIYAAHNRLAAILSTHIPSNLTFLDVRNNQLERLSIDFLRIHLNESATLKRLYLSANPWLCDCEAEYLLYTLRAQQARIPDAGEIRCANVPNVPLLNVSFAEVCKTPILFASGLLSPLIGIFTTAVCLLSIIVLLYKYKWDVKIWLFAHNICLCCINEVDVDEDKAFDAFISYAHQDQQYVNDVLLPGLETGRMPYRICTHERSWLAGAFIPEQIVESVEQSRRTIIVLSQHFAASDWGRMEFRTAHQCALNEGRARIIIIKYGKLTNLENVDNELQAYLKLNTYLEWNDPRFWNKLRYAMPHKFGEVRKSDMLDLDGRRRTNRVE